MKLAIANALILSAVVWAQDIPPAPQDNPILQDPQEETVDVIPGSAYAGPALLNRGGGPSIGHLGPLFKIRPFVTLNSIVDTGLGATTVNSQGQIPYTTGYGIESIFGVEGSHRWKRDSLDIDYRGSARHYTQNSFYDGIDNSLLLDYKHYVSPRTAFVVTENVARYQRSFSLPLAGYYNTGFASYDPRFTGTTTNDLFDTPTLSFMSGGQIIHQFTSRWSVSASGQGFFVRRHAKSLVDSNGYNAQGDIAYRLTRYQTFSVSYNFTHFDFSGQFGQSDIHGASVNYSIRLGRWVEAGILVGALRVESRRLTQVALDPEVAALLGVSFAYEDFHHTVYTPHFGVHLTRQFRRSSASAGYDRTVLPGNGVYTTSSYEDVSLGYNYAGIHKLSLQFGANYNRFSSLGESLGRYRNYSAGAGMGYHLSRGLSLIGRVDARKYSVQQSALNHIYYRALFGFAWSPGEYPLSLW